ncbi:hypothetical protein RclHR1_06910004 [Rhizophagus clarus]|uniref:Uncharacterized protein n=1 Tax=Rhizophagus clarus TaxID=94130 RepID=A0A2Z6SJS4_9GLOM|nr:hypothetical protein RclHR1_06910004 [Rhizophagus clarus]
MADANFFYDIGIISLTSKPQNPLHLLADAAFISENTNNSNKLTQHETSSRYSKYSNNRSDYNREIFTKSPTSNYSTKLTDINETTKLEQKKIKPIKLGLNTNIKPTSYSQIKSSNDDCLSTGKNPDKNPGKNPSKNSGFSTLSKNSSISDLNFNPNKQDFKVRSLAVEFKYGKEKIQFLEQNSMVKKNQDKNSFKSFNNDKIIDDIKKPMPLSSNDKSNDDDIKKQISLPSNDKLKDDDIKKSVSLSSSDESKDDNIKKSVSLSRNNKSKNNIKKPIKLSNKDDSKRKITKKQNNAERKRKKFVKNQGSLQLRSHIETYTTRSNRVSRPPSASSGGRWTGS